MRVAYLCDGFACMVCSKYCKHTFDISHAKNFKVLDKTLAMELTDEEKKEREKNGMDQN